MSFLGILPPTWKVFYVYYSMKYSDPIWKADISPTRQMREQGQNGFEGISILSKWY